MSTGRKIGTHSEILWHFTGGPLWDNDKNCQTNKLKSPDIGYKNLIAILKSKILKESNVVYISEVNSINREMELEDLFPEEFYMKYVNEAYKVELGEKKIVIPLPGPQSLIRRKLEEQFKSIGIAFNKTRPARLMLQDFGKMKPSDLPKEIVEEMQSLFELLNSRLLKMQ